MRKFGWIITALSLMLGAAFGYSLVMFIGLMSLSKHTLAAQIFFIGGYVVIFVGCFIGMLWAIKSTYRA